jgi:hypothetical protein
MMARMRAMLASYETALKNFKKVKYKMVKRA